MSTPQSAPRRWLAALLAMLIGLALAAAAAEIIVRLAFDEPLQPRFVVDPGYGVRWNQARVDTRHYSPGEYDVRVTTNSVGMRGPREYALEKPAGTLRVVLLGDSFTFGFGVEDDQVVSAVLEAMLGAGEPARRAEVVNLGVSGFGQAEELVTWQNRGRAYRPDAVVVLYFDNDIGNNAVAGLYALRPDGGVVRTGQAYLPGVRLQQLLYGIAPVRWLFEHSRAWNFLRNRLSEVVQNALLRREGLESFSDASSDSAALTVALIGELTREIRAAGAEAIWLVIPTQELKSNFPLSAEQVAALGATLVDGRSFLVPGDYYHRDGHWRPSGHAKAAAALAEALADALAGAPAGTEAQGRTEAPRRAETARAR